MLRSFTLRHIMSFEYRVLLPSDQSAVVDLYTTVMMVDEPVAVALGIKAEDAQTFFDNALPELLASALSVGAFDAATGDMLGCRMATPRNLAEPEVVNFSVNEPDQEKMAKLSLTYASIEDGLDLKHEIGVDNVANFQGLMVRRSHRRRGVAREMVWTAIRVAKTAGFNAVMVGASSVHSRRLFEDIGFTTLKTVLMRDIIILNGEALYRDMEAIHKLSLHYLKI